MIVIIFIQQPIIVIDSAKEVHHIIKPLSETKTITLIILDKNSINYGLTVCLGSLMLYPHCVLIVS